jgi:hypothetical protein
MNNVKLLFTTFLLLSSTLLSTAQIAKTQVVRIRVTTNKSQAFIKLEWPSTTWTGTWEVFRRDAQTDTDWGTPLASVPGNVYQFTDSNVVEGHAYEYAVAKNQGTTVSALGYVYSGIEYQPAPTNGHLLLIIDSSYALALDTEIGQLTEDLQADGWKVHKRYFARNARPVDIRSEIWMVNSNVNHQLRGVFLLGHIPVPYSGKFSGSSGYPPPDGHVEGSGNHTGAWPADTYYGDVDGTWTDNTVTLTTGNQTRHHNIPGDGKFDQSKIPSDIDFEVGRVDLYNMDAFSTNDTQLTREYLRRNHLWRTGKLAADRRALIDNNFTGLNLAATGYHNLSAIIPYDSVFDNRDYKTSLKTGSYLWAYGCGAGSYTSCNGIGNTNDFAADSFQNIFTILAGSYFGDWDIKNNLLKAPLANSALTCFWGGIPKWYVHHMALGMHIGYGARLSMNNDQLYTHGNFNFSHRSVHMALMGDPTIRLHYAQPVQNLSASSKDGIITLNWTSSPTPGAVYFVYQVDSATNIHTQMQVAPISQTTYQITDNRVSGRAYYAVRAAVLDQTASGTYYAMSGSSFVGVSHTAVPAVGVQESNAAVEFSIFPNPGKQYFTIKSFSTSQTPVSVNMLDVTGKVIFSEQTNLSAGHSTHTFDISALPGGIYFISIQGNNFTTTKKWVKQP